MKDGLINRSETTRRLVALERKHRRRKAPGRIAKRVGLAILTLGASEVID